MWQCLVSGAVAIMEIALEIEMKPPDHFSENNGRTIGFFQRGTQRESLMFKVKTLDSFFCGKWFSTNFR